MPYSKQVFVNDIYENQNWQFWFLQCVGWAGYSLITFFSITVWDDNVSLSHVGHIALQALLGIFSSWPLRAIYLWVFSQGIGVRIATSTAAVCLLALVWTALRMQTFMWISGERGLWHEFNLWYFGSLFVFLSWTALYFGTHYYQLHELEHERFLEETTLKREEQLKRVQAESSARDAQLQMLRYQLNPHFLFNTLNSINALVRLQENNKAQAMIQRLSQFLRHTLDRDAIENVSLEDELAALNLYLDIEKTRFEDRLKLEFDIDSEAMQGLVPSLILQPIYENSLKYAIAPSEKGGTIRMTARVVEGELQLQVTDTGPGPSVIFEESEERRGVGLSNTLNRLEAAFDNNFTFNVFGADPEGFSVQMNFPYLSSTPRVT